MASIYQAKNYREFLRVELDSPTQGRGARSRLAEHLGVRLSFISVVLSGRQEFGAEHGVRIAEFFDLNGPETEYLVLLIHRERAGSEDLRRLYQAQIERIQKEQSRITSRAPKGARVLGEAELSEYYGAWYPIAVHMCLRNEKLRDPASIARRLGIEVFRVKRAIDLLERIGFIQVDKRGISLVDQQFHFGENSPALRMHHMNWRNAAIRSLDQERKTDLHYSVVLSADPEARSKVRELLLEFVQQMHPYIRDAKDEEIFAVNLDLFDV
jgi:uncharacterized protein (TIGR02147 family)